MFLKFVNVTKLQFLLRWQVFWHPDTEEIFINVFTTARPDGLQRWELNSHSLGGGSAGLISDFWGASWHRPCWDPRKIVIKHIENMLQMDTFTRFTSLFSKKFKPHKINNKIKEIRDRSRDPVILHLTLITRRHNRAHYNILILNISSHHLLPPFFWMSQYITWTEFVFLVLSHKTLSYSCSFLSSWHLTSVRIKLSIFRPRESSVSPVSHNGNYRTEEMSQIITIL